MRTVVTVTILLALAAPALASPPIGTILEGNVWVIDGDTVSIGQDHIRLKGLDAPELGTPDGETSKRALIAIAKRGRDWRCTVLDINPAKGSYRERAACSCTLPNGADPVALMIAQGMGRHWRYWTRNYPALRARYDAAEAKAKAAKAGFWSRQK
jgi:endonuclease YncB( thermonuclease family)